MRTCLRIPTAVLIMLVTTLALAESKLYQASSPVQRNALLELYTSEGCSSCPPADAWLAGLQQTAGIVPLAFHVTYWDYIGWQDRFASAQYDDRQRDIGRHNSASTIYTPQFVLNGKDYRGHDQFSSDIARVMNQPATVSFKLSVALDNTSAKISLNSDIEKSPVPDVAFYLAVYENNLSSQVQDGENEGRSLHHDYVVRKLFGPFIQSQPNNQQSFKQHLSLAKDWKRKDLNLAVFAQNPHNGEILQAMSLKLN